MCDDFKYVSSNRLILSEKAKILIENGERDKAMKMYRNFIETVNTKYHKVVEEDMDFIKNYNFEVALELAKLHEQDNHFHYEYYYVKALRLKRQCRKTNKLVKDMQNEVDKRYQIKLESIAAKKESYSNLLAPTILNIADSRFYKIVQSTVAMEGNSFSLDEVKTFLQTKQNIPKRSKFDHDEVNDAACAVRFVDETFLANTKPINLSDLLKIQQKFVEKSNPDVGGILRKINVVVGTHVPPSHEHVPKMMNEYVEWLRSEEIEALHPIEASALAHFKLSDVHPFCDGNGRASRMLMNIFLQRNGYPAVDISTDHDRDYYKSLEMGGDGYLKAFTMFIAECMERTLDEYLEGVVPNL